MFCEVSAMDRNINKWQKLNELRKTDQRISGGYYTTEFLKTYRLDFYSERYSFFLTWPDIARSGLYHILFDSHFTFKYPFFIYIFLVLISHYFSIIYLLFTAKSSILSTKNSPAQNNFHHLKPKNFDCFIFECPDI